MLPAATRYSGRPTAPGTPGPMARATRQAFRAEWLAGSLEDVAEAELVFFDPDNGIEASSVPRDTPKAGKYVYWDELQRFWERGQSLVIYHHANRTRPVAAQAAHLQARFAERFGDGLHLESLLFRRGSCRFFFVAAQKRHAAQIENAVSRFLSGPWCDHAART